MIPLEALLNSTLFRLLNLSWLEMLDLLLVTISFYLLLQFIQRSRAVLLLRGVLVLGSILFIVTLILPLPAFDWFVRGILIAILVITPIIFQPELRRLLERIGRNTGVTWEVRQTTTEQVLPRLVRVTENLSATYTGALLVLEGSASLQNVIETGVSIGGQATSELLQSIFFPNNPLHDGAVIIREDTVVAAGCVLPLTERPLHFKRRLGTRHRAAVGLSELSDALVVVVSEETGEISVARGGELWRPLDAASLRKYLYEFYIPSRYPMPDLSIWGLIRRTARRLWRRPPIPDLRQLLSGLSLLITSLLLALVTWSFVIQQTDPVQRVRLENIPLQIEGLSPNAVLMTSPPNVVAAIIQTPTSLQPTLGSRSFQAIVSLADIASGPHRIPVQVFSDLSQVQVLEVDPPALDLEVASIISRTLEVTVDLVDQQSLSRAYQVTGTPSVSPNQVDIVGAEPLVHQVSQVRATLSLANASDSLREVQPLRALDESGREVIGVTIRPALAQVRVNIQRRVNARDVGVRVVTDGVPAAGYWLSGVKVTPASVTLQGDPEQLEQVGGFIDTLPVDVSNVAGDVSVQVPLSLPSDVQAVDSNGNPANTVTVQVRTAVRQGNVAVVRPVKLIGAAAPQGITQVNPSSVTLILNGPLPTLNEIAADPDLVQVLIGAAGLDQGLNPEVTPTIIAPEGVQTQVVPPTVSVTLPKNGNFSGR